MCGGGRLLTSRPESLGSRVVTWNAALCFASVLGEAEPRAPDMLCGVVDRGDSCCCRRPFVCVAMAGGGMVMGGIVPL